MCQKTLLRQARKMVKVIDGMAEGKPYSIACFDEKIHPEVVDNLPLPADSIFTQALEDVGITKEYMAKQMKKLLSAKSVKIDKQGKAHTIVENAVRLKTLELWTKVTGNTAPTRSEKKQLTLTKDITDQELDSLLKKADARPETRKTQESS